LLNDILPWTYSRPKLTDVVFTSGVDMNDNIYTKEKT